MEKYPITIGNPPPPDTMISDDPPHRHTTPRNGDDDDDHHDNQTVVSEITFDSNSLYAGPLYPTSAELKTMTIADSMQQEKRSSNQEESPPSSTSRQEASRSTATLQLAAVAPAAAPSSLLMVKKTNKTSSLPAVDENTKVAASDTEFVLMETGKKPPPAMTGLAAATTNTTAAAAAAPVVDEHNYNVVLMVTGKKPPPPVITGLAASTTAAAATAAAPEAAEAAYADFLQEVEPLPMPGSITQGQGKSHHGIPGAHAISGPSWQSTQEETSSMADPNTSSLSSSNNRELLEGPRSTSVTFGTESESHSFNAFTSAEFDELDEEKEHDDGGNDQVIEGKILPDRTNTQPRHNSIGKYMCLILLFAVVLSVLCIIMVYAIPAASSPTQKEEEEAPDNGGNPLPPPLVVAQADESSQQQHPQPPFQDNLPISLVREMQDIESPFHAANDWMLRDPVLSNYSPERQRQRFYLALVYFATNGDHWFRNDHWMSYNVSECEWYSNSSIADTIPLYYVPEVCDENGSMISFSLSRNNLTGTLPLFISEMFLPDLLVFDIGDNQIGGAYPEITGHPKMEVWIIRNNNFEGRLVGSSYYPHIRVIITGGNNFDFGMNDLGNGQPSELQIAYMYLLAPSIEYWERVNHYYAGGLPSELGLLTKLWHFTSNNQLSGTIPSDVGRLSVLQELELSNNIALTGQLPTELGSLTALTYLGIAGTSISGSVPEALCERAKVGLLDIIANCSMVGCCL